MYAIIKQQFSEVYFNKYLESKWILFAQNGVIDVQISSSNKLNDKY
jgi:hypothetical protein